MQSATGSSPIRERPGRCARTISAFGCARPVGVAAWGWPIDTQREENHMHRNLFVKQAATVAAAFGFVAAGAASASAGDHIVSSAFNLASKLTFGVAFDCANHPGPSITLGGGSAKLGPIA